MESKDRRVGKSDIDPRGIGLDCQAAFREIFGEWNPSTDFSAHPEAALDRTAEAQIAAACIGRKPLYFDPWGEYSIPLAKKLRRLVPKGVEVHAGNGMLFVYRPEVVKPILDKDPAFYRPNGESDLQAIINVSKTGQNGELLGYGARSLHAPGSVGVTILSKDNVVFTFFSSNAQTADIFGAERAKDIIDYLDIPIRYQIEDPE